MRDDGGELKYRHATRLQGNDATLSTQNAKSNKIEIAGGLATNRFPGNTHSHDHDTAIQSTTPTFSSANDCRHQPLI